MSGHVAQELGEAAEREFNRLVEMLGYRVLRKRQPRPGIDLIASFSGDLSQKLHLPCTLMRPIFAPDGYTAFSIKRGDFRKKDVDELLRDVKDAQASDDEVLKSVSGCILACNHVKTEGELDDLLDRNVYCWDLRRLIFYATKAKLAHKLAQSGPVREMSLQAESKGSYIILPSGTLDVSTMRVDVTIFIDDHHGFMGYDHVYTILNNVYETGLEPIVGSTGYYVQVVTTIHALGLANSELAKRAFQDYAGDMSQHPKVSFSAEPGLQVYQYGAAPWSAILLM